MDKALFIGTSGEKDSMHQLELITNNLANASTVGFRADFETMKQYQAGQHGQQTRVYSTRDRTYSDFKEGPVTDTGRDLDVAVSGAGFISVQNKDGREGYTRAGNFQIKDGMLKTQAGHL